MASISEEFHVYPSVVRGHHIYKRIWTPDIGELLNVITEDSNEHDAHAVAVLKSDHIVGHVPRSSSYDCLLFDIVTHGHTHTRILTIQPLYPASIQIPAFICYLNINTTGL